MKKLALLLAVALLCTFCSLSVFAESGDLSEPGVLPIWTGSEPYVLRVLVPDNAKVIWEDNLFTKWVEESCNVKLEITNLPAQDTASKFAAMAAAGDLEKFDVVCYNMNMTNTKTYADQGIFMDVSEFYEDGLAVNVDAANAAYPEYFLTSSLTTAEGAIYSIPKIQISLSNETRHKMWVNQAWLDNLSLEVPTTIDEFYEMLVAFRDEDANGNGDPNDEIPFITSTGFGGTATAFLTNAFVFEGDGDRFLLDEDGHVTVSYIQDGWFEACDFLKQLCEEGLLRPESFTYNNDSLKAVACAEEDIVGVVTNSSCAFMGQATDPIRLRYICLNPLTGPEGVCYSFYTASSTVNCWMITSWCTNPELAFRVGDFMFCEEGFLRGRFGIEGENWMTKEDYLAANPGVTLEARYGAMGYEGKYVFYNDIRDQSVNNLYWYDNMPYFAGDVESQGMYVADDGNGNLINLETNATCRQETGSAYYQNCKPGTDVYVPVLSYTSEELAVLAEYQSNIKTYVNEQRTKYIIGDESDLADPEKFIENLRTSFGLDEILEIADAAYQRQYAN